MNPNPVPESGAPVDGCNSDRPYRWIYDQVLRNPGGTAINLTERTNFFDGARFGNPVTGFTITIQPGGEHRQTTRWCSSVNTQHTARTDWTGSDTAGNKIALTGPTITLAKRP